MTLRDYGYFLGEVIPPNTDDEVTDMTELEKSQEVLDETDIDEEPDPEPDSEIEDEDEEPGN